MSTVDFSDFHLKATRGDTLTFDVTLTRPAGLAAVASVAGGAVTAITLLSGFPANGEPLRAIPDVKIVDPVGTGATATAIVTNGEVTGFVVTAGGFGYSSSIPPEVIVSPIDLTGATAKFTSKRDVASSAYVYQLTSAGGSITFPDPTNGKLKIVRPPEATEGLADWPTLYADLEIIEASGRVSTPLKVRDEIKPDASVVGAPASPFDDGSVVVPDVAPEPFASIDNGNVRSELLALAWNNGGQPGASPRAGTITAADLDYFDLTTVHSEAKGFQLPIFDGQRVIFPAYGDHRREGAYAPGPRPYVASYDTRRSFSATSSHQVVDVREVTGLPKAEGWLGGCVDRDSRVYFAPFFTKATGTTEANTLMLRWHGDSEDLSDEDAWESYDLTLHPNFNGQAGWCNAVYDGRYIYYGPISHYSESGVTNTHHGQFWRFDTEYGDEFDAAGAWDVFDLTTVHANAKGFQGLSFDGRYVYLIPFRTSDAVRSGRVVRYDTALNDFHNTGGLSYQTFDLATLNANAIAFDGAVYDGRFLYLVPWGAAGVGLSLSVVARFDTHGGAGLAADALSNSLNWKFFDLTTLPFNAGISAENRCRGYQWGWFDGLYVWFVPSFNAVNPPGGGLGRIPPFVRFDIRYLFDEAGAGGGWQTYDVGDTAAAAIPPTFSPASTGAAWDGRFAYLGPYGFAGQQSGKITRVRGFVPDGMSPPISSDFVGTIRQRVGGSTQRDAIVGAYALKQPIVTINVGTNETTLMTTLLPANTLSRAGSMVKFKIFGLFAANANTKALAVYLGGTLPTVSTTYAGGGVSLVGVTGVALFPAVAHNGGSWTIEGTILYRASNALPYSVTAIGFTAAGASVLRHVSQSVTTLNPATALPLTVTGTSGTAGADIIFSGMTVETAV